MTTHAPSAARRVAIALPMPDAAPVTKRDAGGVGLGLGHALKFGLLERPVLDAELLGIGDRRVGRQRLGAAHHVDGVDVELARDAGGLLVGAEREHADAGHEHDGGVRAADRGGVARRVGVVIGLVVGAIGLVQLLEASDAVLDGRIGRQVEHHGLDLGAQEVVGATRAKRGEARVLGAGKEVEHHVGVGEVAHHRPVDARRGHGWRARARQPWRGARTPGAAP